MQGKDGQRPWIIEGEAGPIIERQDRADGTGDRAWFRCKPVTGHAEVHPQFTAAGKRESLRLSAALHIEDPVADQGFRVPGGQASSLRRMQYANTRYGPATGDAASDGDGVFDLGEFGHERMGCVLSADAGVLRYWLGASHRFALHEQASITRCALHLAVPDECA